MIKELIVVEGKKDAEIVKRAFPQADVLITHGWGLTQAQIEALKTAQRRRGVIVLTDPDRAGEMIRRRLSRLLPGCGHAFIPRNKAIKDGKVGVEAARVEDVYHSLLQVRSEGAPRGEFRMEDLVAHGLSGTTDAARKRRLLGEKLSVGYGNSKNFLMRLNALGVTRAEFLRALAETEAELDGCNQAQRNS
ncbi:MAG: ribonuclease M5 [Bacillota bacterium]|jgi:ribonuclease M5